MRRFSIGTMMASILALAVVFAAYRSFRERSEPQRIFLSIVAGRPIGGLPRPPSDLLDLANVHLREAGQHIPGDLTRGLDVRLGGYDNQVIIIERSTGDVYEDAYVVNAIGRAWCKARPNKFISFIDLANAQSRTIRRPRIELVPLIYALLVGCLPLLTFLRARRPTKYLLKKCRRSLAMPSGTE